MRLPTFSSKCLPRRLQSRVVTRPWAECWTKCWLLSGLLLSALPGAGAAEEAPLEALEPQLIYVELKPTFVTNFGPTDTPRLMYLKTDVSLRVQGRAGQLAADTHAPALRNELVLLLSSLEEASVTTSEGREDARRSALRSLNALLEAEEGEALIEDLLFTNFIVQR